MSDEAVRKILLTKVILLNNQFCQKIKAYLPIFGHSCSEQISWTTSCCILWIHIRILTTLIKPTRRYCFISAYFLKLHFFPISKIYNGKVVRNNFAVVDFWNIQNSSNDNECWQATLHKRHIIKTKNSRKPFSLKNSNKLLPIVVLGGKWQKNAKGSCSEQLPF